VTDEPTGELRGLVVDWGGVLTASLDEAMRQWVAADGVTFQHFEDALRAWSRGERDDPDGQATGHGRAEPVGERDAEPGDEPVADPEDEPVAELEQADDAGPAGWSPVHRLERGEMSAAEFEQVLAAELGRRGSPVRAEGLLRRMLGELEELQDDMVGLVRRAHDQGIRTALLSNSWGNAYPEQLWEGLFDQLVISGRVGMRKPEARIFRHTCALLDLPPERCVMVDDLPHNIAGAVAVGMVGVLHREFEQTAEELEVLFGVPLR
jgi:epoxide hydrolase-like predicted phosphatase